LAAAGEHAEADHAFADAVPEWPGNETSRDRVASQKPPSGGSRVSHDRGAVTVGNEAPI